MSVAINDKRLSEEEEQIVLAALELYARVFQGQFSQIGQMFRINNLIKVRSNVLSDIVAHFDAAQTILHGDTNTSWRIASNFVSRSALKAHILELQILGDEIRANEVMNLAGLNPPRLDDPINPIPQE
jgi:hypothetical protein